MSGIQAQTLADKLVTVAAPSGIAIMPLDWEVFHRAMGVYHYAVISEGACGCCSWEVRSCLDDKVVLAGREPSTYLARYVVTRYLDFFDRTVACQTGRAN